MLYTGAGIRMPATLDALLKTGPTHTNVMDLRVALVQ